MIPKFQNDGLATNGKKSQKITKTCYFELRHKYDMPEGSSTPYFLLVKISKTRFFSNPDFEKARILKKPGFEKNDFQKNVEKL